MKKKTKKGYLLMEESEDQDFGSFQQETGAAEMEEVICLESSMADLSTNRFVLINNVGGAIMKTHYSYVCGIQGVGGGELDMRGLMTTNLAKSKFVSVINDQFAISESQLKATLSDRIFEVEVFGFKIV
ncbi:hypothetical protein AVEN_229613-1 [Araneus ventricosus]|uniref:Uncharacterized protein n=1 Tax=Araneus ventricosus TaxID=182803 RepID=A0A4Y2DA19_ARAVE|nr:hypothetical protein AVEN_229613-1 [Araneus ventricosus]